MIGSYRATGAQRSHVPTLWSITTPRILTRFLLLAFTNIINYTIPYQLSPHRINTRITSPQNPVTSTVSRERTKKSVPRVVFPSCTSQYHSLFRLYSSTQINNPSDRNSHWLPINRPTSTKQSCTLAFIISRKQTSIQWVVHRQNYSRCPHHTPYPSELYTYNGTDRPIETRVAQLCTTLRD